MFDEVIPALNKLFLYLKQDSDYGRLPSDAERARKEAKDAYDKSCGYTKQAIMEYIDKLIIHYRDIDELDNFSRSFRLWATQEDSENDRKDLMFDLAYELKEALATRG